MWSNKLHFKCKHGKVKEFKSVQIYSCPNDFALPVRSSEGSSNVVLLSQGGDKEGANNNAGRNCSPHDELKEHRRRYVQHVTRTAQTGRHLKFTTTNHLGRKGVLADRGIDGKCRKQFVPNAWSVVKEAEGWQNNK